MNSKIRAYAAIGLAIVAALGVRYAGVLAHLGTHVADFEALHGGRLLLEEPDTRLNAWILAWVVRALGSAPSTLFDPNAFHPSPGALTGSEHLVGVALQVWPVWLAGGDALAIHQAALVLSSALLGVASVLFVRSLGGSSFAAGLAGVLAILMPWRVTELSHVQLSSVQFMPIVWLALIWGWQRRLSAAAAIGLGVAFALQMLSSFYLAYFVTFSTLAIAGVLWWRAGPPLPSAIGRLCAAALPGAVAFLGLALPYLSRQRGGGLIDEGGGFDPLGASAWSTLWWLGDEAEGLLNPAANYHVPLSVALLALPALLAWHPRVRRAMPSGSRHAIAALLGVCGFALLMMPGERLGVGPLELPMPSVLFAELVPGFSLLRGTPRWAILIAVAMPLIAGFGATVLESLAGSRGWLVRVGVAGLALVGADLYAVPTRPAWEHPERMEARYARLAELGPGPLLEIPWDAGFANAELASRNLLASTTHWRPLMNGYTGYEPGPSRFLRRIGEELPRRRALERLRDLAGLRFLMIDLDLLAPLERPAWEEALRDGRLRLVESIGDVRIAELPGWEQGGQRIDELLAPEPGLVTLGGVERRDLADEGTVGSLSALVPSQLLPSKRVALRLSVDNRSSIDWPGFDRHVAGLVLARVTWWPSDEKAGPRTQIETLDADLPAGRRMRLPVPVRAPRRSGKYAVCVELVQEWEGALHRLPIDAVWQAAVVSPIAGGDRFEAFFTGRDDRETCGSAAEARRHIAGSRSRGADVGLR